MSFLVVAYILLTVSTKYVLVKNKKIHRLLLFASTYFAVNTNIGLICFGYIYKAAN